MKVVGFLLLAFAGVLQAQTTSGTWALYPPQAVTTQLSIRQPVNSDGSSVWPVKATIPIQYDVMTGYGPVVFESLTSGNPASSALVFTPSPAITFDQLTNLTANYTFSSGNCYGGTMRWSIVFTDNSFMYIYYGSDSTSWQDCTSVPSDPTIDQSGVNLINNAALGGGNPDNRYETSGDPNHYVSYADALEFAKGKTINWVGLIVDGGWHADQIINLGHVTVNDNTFVPKSAGLTATCPTGQATIQLSKIASSGWLTVDEDLIVGNGPDTGTLFRIVDCKYQYNISGKSLGQGQYKVDALIDGVPAVQTGSGTIFALK